ncbi:MAG: DUF5684 domain-containing protein [Actinopolymorphaceae bacterium]
MNGTDPGAGISPVVMVIYLAVLVLMLISMWKVYSKAGQYGWSAIIPIYNIYVMCKIAGRPGWWTVLYIIPIVNIVISIIVSLDVAKAFGKSGVFGFFGLWLFGIIGFPMLAFGSAQYVGPQVGGAPAHA